MHPVTIDDLQLDPAAWQAEFEERRPEMVAYRRARRAELGDLMTLDFEDRETVRWQVNRMIGVENITDHEKINHELSTYNVLVPGHNELTATVLIGIDDMEELYRWKPLLVGVNSAFYVEIDGERAKLIPDDEGSREEEPPMVQYLRFILSDEQVDKLETQGTDVRIGVDHPNYSAEHVADESLRANLAAMVG